MPRAIHLLGLAIFAQGTAEMMLAGFLPELARSLDVSIPQAGLLISGFAVGMLVGAPILAIATLRLARRTTLLSMLLVFAATQVVSALTDSFAIVRAMRMVGAFAYAGFWAVTAATVVALVPHEQRGRAMGTVAGGLTAATVVGLPAGAILSQHWGWQSPFWVVAGLTVVAGIGVLFGVPESSPDTVVGVRRELRGLRVPRLWLSYGMTAAATAALLVTFSYVEALLLHVTHLGKGWTPLVLLGYGLGSLVGIVAGGRLADRRPVAVLVMGSAGVIAVSVGIAAGAPYAVVVVPLLCLLGVVGFMVNPALNSRVFAIAPAARTLAGALNVSAFNIGISVGPWVGGLLVSAGSDYSIVGWVGAAFGLVLLDRAADRESPSRHPQRAATPTIRPSSAATSATASGCRG